MKRALFTEISNRLMEKLNAPQVLSEHKELRYVTRFANQFDNPGDENAIPVPAIAIQIGQIIYSDLSKGIQTAAVRVTLHISYATRGDFSTTDPNREMALKSLCYLEEVHKAIQGFHGLTRTSDEEDPVYDALVVDTITYEATFKDSSADSRRNYEEVESLDASVVVEQEINKPTGSTQGYIIT